MKFLIRFIPVFFLALTLFNSCKKGPDDDIPNVPDQTPDFVTKVTASVVSGFVVDQNNDPVVGATVKAGSTSTLTDKYGYFEFRNVSVIKDAAVVTVEYAGYFKGIKTFIAAENKGAFFRIKLLPKQVDGTVSASSGGIVALTNGLSITFPANGIKVATSGAAYSGTVNVAVHWIDPTSPELNMIMPGDLRGINSNGFMKLLTTYGMAAVELSGAGGELLQMADGKNAGISFPIPASLSATAPSTIPLWYFDEVKGLWKEEGTATKSGDKYVGNVAHFSFWNWDVPGNYVQFSCTLQNLGLPLAFTWVRIRVPNSYNIGYGYTDATGYVSGLVPANSQLVLEVLSLEPSCLDFPIYSQNFTTTNVNYAAGILNVPLNSGIASVSGRVIDCNNLPVSNGYIMTNVYNQYTFYNLASNGTYSFSVSMCTSTIAGSILGVDATTVRESDPMNVTITPGANVIPDIQACNSPTLLVGSYSLSGFHNRPTFNYPYTNVPMKLIGFGTNELSMYWPEAGSVGHPIATDANNSLSWYGPTIAPVIRFDPVTNEITNVFNSDPGGAIITFYNGPIPTHNYYDPASRKVYVAWEYNTNPDRAFFDTLTYTGP